MNKADKMIVALLFLLLLAWGFYNKTFQTPPPSTVSPVLPADAVLTAPETDTASAAPLDFAVEGSLEARTPPPEQPAPPAAPPHPVAPGEPSPDPASDESRAQRERAPESFVVLANSVLSLTVSTWGGGIVRAELLEFPATSARDEGHVTLDFNALPAVALTDFPGLDRWADFTVARVDGTTQAVLAARAPDGVALERTIRLEEGYLLFVVDAFSNEGAAQVVLPPYGIQVGPMDMMGGKIHAREAATLGIDTLPELAGRDVTYWSKKKLPTMFGGASQGGFLGGCARQSAEGLPETAAERIGMPVSWAAVKNKFFVQILRPTDGAVDCELYVERDVQEPNLALSRVAARAYVAEKTLTVGETFQRESALYVGPKKHSVLQTLGYRQDEIMQFGWWAWFRWVCAALLGTLNAIYAVIPNYGVAIILLTIIVKIVFWPLTHKGTESAKKMQKLQPLLAELKLKYKGEPQKMQQAQMALYREHKVNPMASCLPMLVQLPIFIALFTVLRSAVELRFAEFLWVRDLSEAENLFASSLPIPLNILPILMTATMVWQQKLTPTTGDPQQQKMMMIMPVVMLFILYNMASALVLYWTVSQCLSIVQLLYQHRNDRKPVPIPA